MDPVVAEAIERMQLEIEALAAVVAGSRTAARAFTKQRQEIRDLLRRDGHPLAVNPDPHLGTYLEIAAKREQDARFERS